MLGRVLAGVAVVLVLVGAVALVPAAGAGDAGPEQVQPPQTAPAGFTNAEFEIQAFENATVRWSIRASRPLDNQSEIDQFRTFADTFESTETDTFSNFKTRADRLATFGSDATGREMTATGFDRRAYIDDLGQTQGVVEMSFRWTNFAREDGDQVLIDDVFEGGMFIDNGQRLVVRAGSNLTFESVAPAPDSQSVEGDLAESDTVTWFGERDFADSRPRTVLVVGATQADTATQTPDNATAPDSSSGVGFFPLIVAFVLLLGLGGGLAWYSGAFPGGLGSPTGSTSGGDGPGPGPAGADAASAGAEASIPEEDLLSDEDRVIQLLDDNGGRMKQVKIVDETEWSKSKVSMLLSDMEEEGQISKLRVGRENIISKAGEEPDAVGSPFDEE